MDLVVQIVGGIFKLLFMTISYTFRFVMLLLTQIGKLGSAPRRRRR